MLSTCSAVLLLIIGASYSEACSTGGTVSTDSTGGKNGGGGGGGKICPPTATVTGQSGKVYGTCGSYDDSGASQGMQQLMPGHGARNSRHNKIMPWLVFIQTPTANCTGIIIKEQWIATLQSCVADATSITILAGVNVSYTEGGCTTTTTTEATVASEALRNGMGGGMMMGGGGKGEGGMEHGAVRPSPPRPVPRPVPSPRLQVAGLLPVFKDSRYNATSHAYDVALVKLATALTFDLPDIQPVCLPTASTCNTTCSTSNFTRGRAHTHGWVPDAGAPDGGQFNQYAVVFQATAQACQAQTTSSAVVGSTASVLTVSTTRSGYTAETACLFPNGPFPGLYTFTCCILDFINQIITNN